MHIQTKFLRFFIFAWFLFAYSAYSFSQGASNKGKDFWVGYGHHQFMEKDCSGNYPNNMNMLLYLSNTESTPATVTVTLHRSGPPPYTNQNLWYKKTYTVPPNTVITSEIIPKGVVNVEAVTGEGLSNPQYDARLVTDPAPAGTGGSGLFANGKGIHIESNIPIVVYAHIYGSAASGATMLLPVSTWGYTYTSINSKQEYAGNCFNWMYIIAAEDNTVVEITPSVLTRGQNTTGMAPNVTKTVTLSKGQIYQLVGALTNADANGNNACGTGASTGFDLTGTFVKSTVGPDGKCHPIAVFAGSSRTANPASCGSGGGDNDNQQLFPYHTWGKQYLTTPFSGSSTPSSFGTSTYKVVVKDPTTIVKRNGTQLTNLIGNKYYSFESSTADYIESDKPVMVAQFMTGGNCLGAGGLGDPEMIVISPIEQGIKNLGFYRNTRQSIQVNYITLTVPTAALPSLKIDNSSIFSHTYAHPNKPGYTVVIKRYQETTSSAGQGLVKCDSPFTAIIYGLGSVESYGYNAGAQLNNLNGLPAYHNMPDTSNISYNHPYTYVNAPIQMGANIAYKPTKMVWQFSTLGCSIITPCADVTEVNPIPLDSGLIGSSKYYRYRLPGTYTFSTAGTYYVPIELTSPNADNGSCNNQETVYLEIVVKDVPTINYTYTQTVSCATDSVRFQAPLTTPEGYKIIKYKWTFPNGDTSALQNPAYFFNVGSYQVKLEIVVENGGYATITQTVNSTSGGQPNSTYTLSATSICLGQTVTTTPTSSYAGTTGWYWDFGAGTPGVVNTNAAQTFTYTTAGTYIIKHTLQGTGAGFPCAADTVKKTVVVAPVPVINNVTPVSPTTCGGTDGKLLINGLSPNATYTINYAFNTAAAAPIVATASSTGVVTISGLSVGNYTNITATIGSCTSSPGATATIVAPTAPTAPVVTTSAASICEGGTIFLIGTINTSGSYTYNWTGPNGFTNSTATNPSISNATTAMSGTYSLTVTQNNCTSAPGTVNITVTANPIIGSTSFTNPTACATNTGTISLNGLTSNASYTVSYSKNGGAAQTVTATSSASGVVTITGLGFGSYSNITVTLNTCTSNPVGQIVLTDPNPPATPVAVGSPTTLCAGNSINLSATSSTAGVSFEWSGPNSYTAIGATQTITNTTIANSGTYTVVAKLNGCTSASSNAVNITVNPIPATPSVTSNSPICAGTALNLASTISSTGTVSYSWSGPNGFTSTQPNPSIANPTVVASGNYSLTITENGCTSAAASTPVVVNVVPVINISSSSNPTSCLSTTGSITLNGLTANTSYTVNYTIAATTQTVTISSNASGALIISNLAAGTYSNIKVTTSSNCTSNTVGPVTLTDPAPPAAPTVTVNNSPVCSGTAINLAASSSVSGVTYTWTNPSGGTSTGSTLNIAASTASDAGTYTVKVTSNNCTSAAASASVIVKPTPAITLGGSTNPTSCATNTGTITLSGLTANTAYTVNYSRNTIAQTATITASSSGNVIITNLNAATYTNFSVTLNGCISNVLAGPVSLSDPNPPATPIITPNPSAIVCVGNNVTLVANSATSGAIVYNWTGPNGFVLNNNNTVTLNNITAASAGTYSVTATLGACVSSAGTVVLTVNPTPTITTSSSTNPTNCNTNTGTIILNGLTPTTAYTVTYTTGINTSNVSLTSSAAGVVVVPGLAAGTYSNVFVTLGACPSNSVGPFTLTDPAAPGVSIISNNSPLCEGANLSIVASSPATTGVITYTWVSTSGYTGSGNTVAISNVSTSASGTYTVTATRNNCTSTASTLVSVKPYPITDFEMSPSVCMPNGILVLTNKTTVPDGSLPAYTWDFGDGSTTSAATNPTHIYSISKPYVITLTATAGNGCSKTINKTFDKFYDKPLAMIGVDQDTLCLGPTTIFGDSSKATNSQVINWAWDFGDGTPISYIQHPTHKFATPGQYDVRLVVENLQSCTSDTAHQLMVVYQQPIIDAGPSFIVPQGSIVTFNPTVNDSTNVLFLWTPAADFVKPDTLRPNLLVTANKTYYLTAYGEWQCTATDSLTVTALKLFRVPNAFSPNGDNVHDKWEIEELKDYAFAEIDIFDRNGRVVYHSKGYNKPWDGTLNGTPLPIGTYYYIIDLKNRYPKQAGYVTILR